jgi:hypothetical protein
LEIWFETGLEPASFSTTTSEPVRIGVAAHQVQKSIECLADPSWRIGPTYVTLEHPLLGPVVVDGPGSAWARTPGRTASPDRPGNSTHATSCPISSAMTRPASPASLPVACSADQRCWAAHNWPHDHLGMRCIDRLPV